MSIKRIISQETIRKANEAMLSGVAKRNKQFQNYSRELLNVSVFYDGELYTQEIPMSEVNKAFGKALEKNYGKRI